ncbi:tissue factor-like isoform X1 [Enoplosus armatus]|uniref:tissue factor-like isoform X1 n=1 Tax=Enoplosus armatus TaxID=215367 RepID=UPI0039949E29
MASLKTLLYLGICLSAWIITTADNNFVPKAEQVHWVSLDFKTILTWTTKPSNYTYTVLYSGLNKSPDPDQARDRRLSECRAVCGLFSIEGIILLFCHVTIRDEGNWRESPDCIRVSESECDLTNYLVPFDRTYSADIQTEPASMHNDYDLDLFPHTYSLTFNPYRESNISAVKFTVEDAGEGRAIVNITDPLTSVHQGGKQLSIRDVLRKDLKYKISYYKSGSTGKRDITSDTSMAEVSELDAEQSYCFMVAAYIPSRKTTQLGAWSLQQCTHGHVPQEWSLGAWVGGVFILLTVLIILVTVTVLCCKCCRQRNKTLHTPQSSALV